MVTDEGMVKIIDFGFGKKVIENNDKASIILNWPVSENPAEIYDEKYDHRTEVYFVGKLFLNLLKNNGISNFKYDNLVSKMSKVDPEDRIGSFEDALQFISAEQFREELFNSEDKKVYQEFADATTSIIHKIVNSMNFKEDKNSIISALREIIENSVLEKYIQNSSEIVKCFISNSFSYASNRKISVQIVHDFYRFLTRIEEQQQNIVLNNLKSRFKNISVEYEDDDIPF